VTRRRNVFSSILPKPRIRSVRTVRTTNTISPTRKSARPVWPYLMAKSAATAPKANALNRRDTMWLEVFTRPTDATAEVSWRRICVITEAPARLRSPKSAP